MLIPSPAVVKKQLDARKAREAELASELNTASQTKKLPSTKGSSNFEKKKSTTGNAKTSKKSSSFPKAKGSPDRSSRQKTSKNSSNSTKLIREKSESTRPSKAGNSTSTIKNSKHSWKSENNTSGESRKAFVRPEHLTQKPLRDNEQLQSLKKELEKPARGQFKRQYRVGGRAAGKTHYIKNLKENK